MFRVVGAPGLRVAGIAMRAAATERPPGTALKRYVTMYCSFFGLRCLPFEDRADTQFALTTSAFKEEMAALGNDSRYGKGLALIEGEAGAGKTLLIRLMLMRMGATDHVVVVNLPGGRETDLIREACKGFGVTLPASYSYARGLARLRRHLIGTVKTEHRSTLIVDQAENLTPQNIGHLAALAELRVDAGRLLTTILVAQPLPENLLQGSEFASLEEHFFARRKLPALTPEETEEYIPHRLQVAGAAESVLFEPDAVEVIHRGAGGNPRRINQLCHAAMVAACNAGDKSIRRETAVEVTPGSTMIERSADVQAVTGRSPGCHPAPASWPASAGAEDSWPADGDVTAPPWDTGEPAPTGTGEPSSPVLERQSRTEGSDGLGLMQEQQDEDYDVLAEPASAKQTAMAVSMEAGEAWVGRLERLLARAERVASTHEASIAQYTAVEKHLTTLTTSAERLTERLAGAARQASTTVDGFEKRTERLFKEGERRAGAIEAKATRTMEASLRADEQVQHVENACEQAGKVEARLTGFAEQLADKADDVQERLSSLMNELASGEDVHTKLRATIEKTSTFTGQAQTRIDAQQAKLEETISEAKGLQSRFTADAEAKISGLSDQFQATIREGERHLKGVGNLALKHHRDKLLEQSETLKGIRENAIVGYREKLRVEFEAHQLSQREVIEAARTDCDALEKRTATITAETDQAINEAHEKLGRRLGDAQRSAREFTDVALDLAQQKLEAHEGSQRKVVEATISAHRAKLRELLDESASQVQTIEAGVAAARKKADQTLADSERLQAGRIEKLRKEREQVRQELEAQEATQRKVVEATISAHRAKLRELFDESASQVQTIEAGVAAARKRADQTLADSERSQAGRIEKLRKDREEIQQELEAHEGSQRKVVETTISAYRAKLQELLDESASQVRAIEAGVAAARKKADQALADSGKSQAGRLEKLRKEREEAGQWVETLETRIREVQSLATPLGDQIDGAATRANELTRTVQLLNASVTKLGERADSARADLAPAVERTEKLVSEVKSLSGRIEAQQHQVANSLTQIGSACATVSAARDQVRQQEEVAGRLASGTSAGEQVVGQLGELLKSAKTLQVGVQRAIADAAKNIGQLDSHNAAAGVVFRKLSDVAVDGRKVIEQADKSAEAAAGASQEAHEASQAAKEQIDRWTSKQTVAERMIGQLDEAVSEAVPLRDAVEGLVGEATEKIGQLDSHNAAASHVLRELSDVNVAAHRAAQETSDAAVAAELATQSASEQSDRLTTGEKAGAKIVRQLEEVVASAGKLQQIAQQTVTDAAGRIGQLDAHSATAGRLIRELSDANTNVSGAVAKADDAARNAHEAAETTEDRTGQLADCTARAERFLEAANSATQQGDALTRELAGYIEQAEGKVRSMADHCGETNKAVERLGSIRGELRAATETADTVRNGVEQAQSMYNALSSMTESARQYNDELGGLTCKAESLTGIQRELTGKAEVLTERLSDRLSAGKASLETGEQLLDEFVTQAHTVSKKLDDLHRTADKVQQTVSEATEKPARIIASAQVQTAQLERVCSAVRKVFAGLSKVTLEARSRTEGFRGTSQEAAERLGRLTSETDRASKALREWIEEATLVQSRLERTLKSCPSIRETHPVGGLDRLSKAVTPLSGKQSPPIPAPEGPAVASQIAGPAGRAQVVSQIIEDAKRAANPPSVVSSQ